MGFEPEDYMRQDSKRLVPLPVGVSFQTTFEECCYIHYLRLLATAMDSSFQNSVNECLGGVEVMTYRDTVNVRKRRSGSDPQRKRSLILDRTYENGIKGYERMYNKMGAVEDHRFEKRPRPAQNIDINRCLVVCESSKHLRNVLVALRLRYGAFVKFKNGFSMSKEDAKKGFYLRLCIVTVAFSHHRFRNMGDVCRDREVSRLWLQYAESEPPSSVSRGTWIRQIETALGWLRDPALSRKPVKMAMEIQVLLRNSRDVRMRMHEMYVVGVGCWKARESLSLSLSLFLSLQTYNAHTHTHTGTKYSEQRTSFTCFETLRAT